jgi:hypothetical protein
MKKLCTCLVLVIAAAVASACSMQPPPDGRQMCSQAPGTEQSEPEGGIGGTGARPAECGPVDDPT